MDLALCSFALNTYDACMRMSARHAVAAWLSLGCLLSLSRVAYAGEPLKPYVLMVVDTSGSMDSATSAGPPSCGGADTRLNHAKCAINKLSNSYGDMVLALGRFRHTQ